LPPNSTLHSIPTRRSSDLSLVFEDPNGNLFAYSGGSFSDTLIRAQGTSTSTSDYSGCVQPASPNSISGAAIGSGPGQGGVNQLTDRKSTRLNSSHQIISYA